jgi:hypothetical protein
MAHGAVKKSGRGSSIFVFYCIFMLQFFKVLCDLLSFTADLSQGKLYMSDFRVWVANAGPAGHFWHAMAFEMAHEDFMTGSDRKFESKLALKDLKTWAAKVHSEQILAP